MRPAARIITKDPSRTRVVLAHYGYRDASGEFFIVVDTDRCNGCGACVEACPRDVFALDEDAGDPFREGRVATVGEEQRNKLKYVCGPCKSASARDSGDPPCAAACAADAISHSW